VDQYLAAASLKHYPKERLLALISPHAGYVYSGLAAAYGYNRLNGQVIHRVIILAPSHYVAFHGVSIPDVTHYETPLGKIPLAREITKKLLLNPLFSTVPQAHTKEHSVEMQLPMLQRVLKDFSLVPLVFGQVGKKEFKGIAGALRPFIDKETLLIASSDFTHYGPRFEYVPFKDNVRTRLRALDLGAVDRILAGDFEGFLQYRQRTGATICGFVPIATLLKLLPADTRPRLLHYYTSGDLTGDYQNSVSYVSMAFYEGDGKETAQEKKGATLLDTLPLNGKEQETLLTISRKTLEEGIRHQRLHPVSPPAYDLSPRLMSNRGVFVTLQENGRLRGCIGNIIGTDSLFRGVAENTLNSALRDTRFEPVRAEELPAIDIEISVLTPPEPIARPEDFIVGRHGIILREGGSEAVFLPQVAPEQGWDREETLTHLSLKAGLSEDAWKKKDARFLVFHAQVFGEKSGR